MTNITNGELKIIFYCLVLVAIMGVFAYFYNQSPVPVQTYNGQTSTGIGTSANGGGWIDGLLGILPAPFDDPQLLPITAVFIAPITVMLSFIALRVAKDLITQWV